MMTMRNQYGMVYVMALSMMLMMLSLGMSYMYVTRLEVQIADNEIKALQSLYDAESGTEHMLAKLCVVGTSGWVSVSQDLENDGTTSYLADYDPGTQEIISTAPANLSNPSSHVVTAVVSPAGAYTGALQVGGAIPTVSAAVGTIASHVDARGTISSNMNNLVDTGLYVITPNNTMLSVPVPDLSASGYGGSTNFTSQGLTYHTHPDCTDLLNFNVDVHYVVSNCTITSGSGFVLNGALIVNGSLTIGPISGGFPVFNPPRGTALGDLPAIVASGNIVIQNLNTPTFDGLIYAGGDLSFTVIAWGPRVNDPMIAGNNLNFTQVRIDQAFDLSLVDPPFFTGGGGGGGNKPSISSWTGHSMN